MVAPSLYASGTVAPDVPGVSRSARPGHADQWTRHPDRILFVFPCTRFLSVESTGRGAYGITEDAPRRHGLATGRSADAGVSGTYADRTGLRKSDRRASGISGSRTTGTTPQMGAAPVDGGRDAG